MVFVGHVAPTSQLGADSPGPVAQAMCFSRLILTGGGNGMATAHRGIRQLLLILALSAVLTTVTTASVYAIGVGCGGACNDSPALATPSGDP